MQILKIPRFFHHIYSIVFGYFWERCPFCGKMFGGHEKNLGTKMISWGTGIGTCSACVKEANEYNKIFLKNPEIWPEE